MDDKKLLESVASIASQIHDDEKLALFHEAQCVKPNGLIVEIGSLCGSSTACLALGAPNAIIISIDNFSYDPLYPPFDVQKAGIIENYKRLTDLGINNVKIVQADSQTYPVPNKTIDLLWIDGSHVYEEVHHDLFTFGMRAITIMCHDYDSEPYFPGVSNAVNEFLQLRRIDGTHFVLDHMTHGIAVMKIW